MKEFVEKLIERLEKEYFMMADSDWSDAIDKAIAIVKDLVAEVDMGNVSDGYHTFNELYHHRAVLFSVICNANKDNAWKSKLHDTGDMYDGMFIVGIDTPNGQATYHYDINPYWDMFDVKELPKAPKWDGHSPADAIERIGRLAEYNDGWIPCSERLPEEGQIVAVTLGNGIVTAGFNGGNGGMIGFYGMYASNDVIAWRPLPKPYREKGEKE